MSTKDQSRTVPDEQTESEEQQSRKKLLDLSPSKVAAGALAAVTTAVAASYLGAAGTVIGAGLGSVVATVSTAIYQHSLDRSSRRLQRALPKVWVRRPDGRMAPVTESSAEGTTERTKGSDTAKTGGATGRGDAEATRVFGVPAASARGAQSGGAQSGKFGAAGTGQSATLPASADDPAATRILGAVRPGFDPVDAADPAATSIIGAVPAGTEDAGGRAVGRAVVGAPPPGGTGTVYGGAATRPLETVTDEDDDEGPWWSYLPWKRIAVASAAIFVVVLGVITTVELMSGRSVSALVRGDNEGTRPTVVKIVRGENTTTTDSTPTPETSPGETSAPSPSGEEEQPASESPQPNSDESTDADSSGESAEPRNSPSAQQERTTVPQAPTGAPQPSGPAAGN